MNLLRDVYRLIDLKSTLIEHSLSTGQLRDLTIEAHSLKNLLRMMGASELSRCFGLLEDYGRTGNIEGLEEETPPTLKKLRQLKPLLRPYGESAEHGQRVVSVAEFAGMLLELKRAISEFDVDLADEIMRRLDEVQSPAQCEHNMELLRAYMADLAMAEVIDLADTLLDILDKQADACL